MCAQAGLTSAWSDSPEADLRFRRQRNISTHSKVHEGSDMIDQVVGSKACKPNPSLEPLAFLIGDWSTTGTHPDAPNDTLPGLTTFAWAEGGAFLIMRSQTEHQDFPMGCILRQRQCSRYHHDVLVRRTRDLAHLPCNGRRQLGQLAP